MDELISKIDALVGSKSVLNAEQSIMTIVHDIDGIISGNDSDEIIEKLFNSLLSLFSINKGNFSVQCGRYIASKIVKLFKISQIPKFWDVVSMSIQINSQAAISATSYICDKVGMYNKSQIPRFMEYLLKIDPPNYASLQAIRSGLKAAEKSASQFAQDVYELLKKTLPAAKQNLILPYLKLLRTLIKIPPITVPQILDCVKLAIKFKEHPFIKNDLGLVVARCASLPYTSLDLKQQFQSNEWSIGKLRMETQSLDLEPAFELISMFPDIIGNTIIHFLNLLGPELITMNHTRLFRYIRASCPDGIKYLMPMLPADLRFSYFREISKEPISGEQLKTLTLLCPDDGCLGETAGIALLLSTSDIKADRNAAADFFAEFSSSHPQVVLPYLHSSLVLLAQPPERNPHILRDLKGNASVALTILRNLEDPQTAIVENSSILQKLISDAFKKPKVTSYKFIFSFSFLTYLPSDFADPTKAIDFVISYLSNMNEAKPPKMTHSLLKSVFHYCSGHSNENQNKELLKIIPNYKNTLSFSVASDLCKMIHFSSSPYTLIKLVLDFALKAQPSVNLINKYIKRPLPSAQSLIYRSILLTRQQKKHDNFMKQFIQTFPSLISSCDVNDQKKVVLQLLQNITITSGLILLSISNLMNILPPKYGLILFKATIGKKPLQHSQFIQIISESIAKYLISSPQNLPEIFGAVISNNSSISCIILSSIFLNIKLHISYVNQSLIFLDKLAVIPASTAVALHSLSSLLQTHQMQITSLNIASNQFPILFQVINSSSSLQPVTLHIIGECYGCLIETFSSDLGPEFSLMIELILRSIEITPMDYAREVYYESSQAIYTFLNSMSYLAPLIYPQSRSAPASLQLTSCAAFSDFLKFQVAEFDLNDIIPKLLILLQRTGDERAMNFIIALASLMKHDDVSFWISTIKRILISSSLLEGGSFIIEPGPEVKLCSLKIALYIVPIIASQENLVTENLDDLISAVCRGTETDRVVLQEAAFPTLQKVIDLFKDRTTDEGQRLLDLYDSQFSMAVKVGFKVNLLVSGGFLSNYLTFNTDNMDVDPENCSAILVVYLSGLKECPQRSASYFSLATHLCTVARKYPPLCELINPFLQKLTPIFYDLVKQEIQLWNPSSDWRSLSEFRSLAQTFYIELLPAFVWLQKITTSIIDIDHLTSIILIEIVKGKEPWIRRAAFEALPVLIEAFGSKIPPKLLNLSIVIANGYVNKMLTEKKNANDIQYSTSGLMDTFAALLADTAAHIASDEKYDQIRVNILSLSMTLPKFSPTIFSYIIKSDTRKTLTTYGTSIFVIFIKNYKDKSIPALIAMLFWHSPSIIGSSLLMTIDSKLLPVEFKIEVIFRGLILEKDNIPLDAISRFCISTFKKGSMHMVGRILVEREEIGVALLAEGASKASFLLCGVEKGNCRAYLRFIQLSLNILGKYKAIADKFAKSSVVLALSIAAKFGGDTSRYGHQILSQCIWILKDSRSILQNKFEDAFNSVDIDERTTAIKNISSHIYAEEQRKKVDQLVEFSTNQRGKSHGEWQTLEIEGIDDSD